MLIVALAGCGGREYASLADPRYPDPPPALDGSRLLAVASDDDDVLLAADGSVRAPEGDRNVIRPGDVLRLTFAVPPEAPAFAGLVLPVDPRPGQGPLELSIGAVGTGRTVTWRVPAGWADPWAAMPVRDSRAGPICAPFERNTPELTALLADPEVRASGRVTLELRGVTGELAVWDALDTDLDECPGHLAPQLEWAPDLWATLAGKPLVGRVTDTSAALTVLPRTDLEVQAVVDGVQGPVTAAPAREGLTLALTGLPPDAEVSVVTRIRRPGDARWTEGPPLRFHTRRPPGSTFTFAVTSDCHFLNMEHRRAFSSMHLFGRTMDRIAADRPDFLLDLGDSLNGESYRSWDAPDREEILRRMTSVRPYFERALAPAYLVIGNHEGEQGWRQDGLPELAEAARLELFPTPAHVVRGRPRDWWATTWGDVLVVAIDPYASTLVKPHDLDGSPGSNDRWDWSLGKEQADWLAETLHASDARWKLVVSHQVTGGTNEYGRGGRLAAKPEGKAGKAKAGTYEWGGTNPNGSDGMAKHRPGWARPIHRILAEEGVTAFVHGHDHVFAFERPLDGVGYLTVPQPGDARYDAGHAPRTGLDPEGTTIENSGYVRFTSSPEALRVEYVRSFLPGDGEDGAVAFSYTFTDCDGNGVPDLHDAQRGGAPACGR